MTELTNAATELEGLHQSWRMAPTLPSQWRCGVLCSSALHSHVGRVFTRMVMTQPVGNQT